MKLLGFRKVSIHGLLRHPSNTFIGSNSCPPQIRYISSLRVDDVCRDSHRVLYEKNIAVTPFESNFQLRTPISSRIFPLESISHANLDAVIVKLTTSPASDNVTNDVIEELKDIYVMNDEIKEDKNVFVNIYRNDEDVKLEKIDDVSHILAKRKQVIEPIEDECLLHTSAFLPVNINTRIVAEEKADVEISDFSNSQDVHIHAEEGEIQAANIKSGVITAQSRSGDVVCSGVMQGSIWLTSESGDVVSTGRIVGPSADISTESGDIRLSSCYAQESKITTFSGSMKLNNLHFESYLAVYQKGDVEVKGVDGTISIYVKEGDVFCECSFIRSNSKIHVEQGNIHLKLSDDHPVDLKCEGNDVLVDANFRKKAKIFKNESKRSREFRCIVGSSSKSTDDQFEEMSEERHGKHTLEFDGSTGCSEFKGDEGSSGIPKLGVSASNGNVIVESYDWTASWSEKSMRGQPNNRQIGENTRLESVYKK